MLMERKKDAERLAKMQLIMIDDALVIEEDDNASINDQEEDTESKKTITDKSSLRENDDSNIVGDSRGYEIQVFHEDEELDVESSDNEDNQDKVKR